MSENEVKYGSGRVLFNQGEKGGDLYFIKSGRIQLTVRDLETGLDKPFSIVEERNILGSMSFLEGDPRSATAKTITDVTCIVIAEAQRDQLLKSLPAWVGVLLKDLSNSLRIANNHHMHFMSTVEHLEEKLKVKEKIQAKLEKELQTTKQALDKLVKDLREKGDLHLHVLAEAQEKKSES